MWVVEKSSEGSRGGYQSPAAFDDTTKRKRLGKCYSASVLWLRWLCKLLFANFCSTLTSRTRLWLTCESACVSERVSRRENKRSVGGWVRERERWASRKQKKTKIESSVSCWANGVGIKYGWELADRTLVLIMKLFPASHSVWQARVAQPPRATWVNTPRVLQIFSSRLRRGPRSGAASASPPISSKIWE